MKITYMPEYHAIAVWHRNSDPQYIRALQQKAAAENASFDVLYYTPEGRWVTVRDLQARSPLQALADSGVESARALLEQRDAVTDPKSPADWRDFLLGKHCKRVCAFVQVTAHEIEALEIPVSRALALLETHGSALRIARSEDGSTVLIGGPVR